MAWKNFVAAGLLCLLASPVFAAPTVDASVLRGTSGSSGHLDSNGNWIWTIRLFQSNPPVDLPDPDGGGPFPDSPPGSPLAVELGFTVSGELVSASVNPIDFDDPNPGNVIFGWETLTTLGGSGNCGSGMPGRCPVGFQTSTAHDQVFAALGSNDYGTDTDGKDFATIIAARPVTPDANTDAVETLTMSGAYGSGGNKGRIAELNQAWDPRDNNPPISVNYDTYAGSVTRIARGGDTNLDGTINFADFGTLQTNYVEAGAYGWADGDYNGDAQVTSADFDQLEANYQESYAVFSDSNFASSPGPGSGGGGPEPAGASPAGGPGASGVTYILDLSVDNTWRVLADVSDGDNFGIASYSFQFSGQTTTHDNASPQATAPLTGFGKPAGFTLLRSADDANAATTESDVTISGSQDTVILPNENLVYGFGQEGSNFLLEGVIPGGTIEQPVWTEPILLAQGTYDRLANPSLTINLMSNLTFVNVFTAPNNPVDNVNPPVGRISNSNENLVVIAFVPEPSTIALLGFAALGMSGHARGGRRKR